MSYKKVSIDCYLIKFNVIDKTFTYKPIKLNKQRKVYQLNDKKPLTVEEATSLFELFNQIPLQNSSCLFNNQEKCIEYGKHLNSRGYKYCQ